jgi:hypothetical protein
MADPHQDPAQPTDHVANLGATLTALAKSPEDQDCLEVFAELLHLGTDELRPHLFTVLLEPAGGAQILTIGHACPGLTLQVDADLEVRLPQLWFQETDGDD